MAAVNNFLISNEYSVQGVKFGIDTRPRFYVRVVAAHSAYSTTYIGDRRVLTSGRTPSVYMQIRSSGMLKPIVLIFRCVHRP